MFLSEAKAVLGRMFDPMDADAFLGEVLGKRFLKLDGKPGDWRSGLLGDDPARALLASYARFAGKVGSHAEAPTGPVPPVDAIAGPSQFKALIETFHDRAYTVRLPDVRPLSAELDRFGRALEYILDSPVKAEVFWSRGDAGAPQHCDYYDIIVVQLAGKKRWQVSKEPADLANDWKHIPDGRDRLEAFDYVMMQPGDLAYLPRGTYHRVDGMGMPSIHLSIGFKPLTLRDAMIAALDHLSDQDIGLRTSVEDVLAPRLESGEVGDIAAQVRKGVEALAAFAASDENMTEALRRRSARMISKLDKADPVALTAPLTAQARMRHRAGSIAAVTSNGTKASYSYPGGEVNVPAALEGALRYIATTPEFRIGDIPGDLTDEIRLALAAKLVECGVLEAA